MDSFPSDPGYCIIEDQGGPKFGTLTPSPPKFTKIDISVHFPKEEQIYHI